MQNMLSTTLYICIHFCFTFYTVETRNQLQYTTFKLPYPEAQPKLTIRSTYRNLVSVFEALNLEFGFPNEQARNLALQKGYYKPENPIPIDVDVYYPKHGGTPRIFLTIPRFDGGVPYSLAYLTNVLRTNGPELQPFPHYNWHSSHGRDCNGITSVYRIQIDCCGQMWILDSGEIGFVQYCAPQLVVIDLKTDKLVHRYRLPENMYKANISRFVMAVVDIADPPPIGNCRKGFVYMADPLGFNLVVYDIAKQRTWRIENKYTYPNPDFGTHTIAGESFELLDGVFGLAFTPRDLGLKRMLYFHSLSSDVQMAVPLDVVNNASLWLSDSSMTTALDQFVVLGRRGVQCAAPAMSELGYLLCGYLEPIGIFAWNIRAPYTFENRILLAENPTTLQFVSGLKIIKNPLGKEEVWVVSNRLQRAFTGRLKYTEINYRLQRCGMEELLMGHKCS